MTAYPAKWDEKAPHLTTIAKWINANTTLFAETERVSCSTDRKIPGTRLRSPGKGLKGIQLKVWTNVEHRHAANTRSPTPAEKRVLDKCGSTSLYNHNSAYALRRNSGAVMWLQTYLRDNPKALIGKGAGKP